MGDPNTAVAVSAPGGLPGGGTVIAFVLLVILAALYAAAEIAVFSTTRFYLDRLPAAKRRQLTDLESMLNNGKRTLAYLLIGFNAAAIAATVAAYEFARRIFPGTMLHSAILAGAIAFAWLLIAGYLLPRSLTVEFYDGVIAPLARVARVLNRIMSPMRVLLGSITRRAKRLEISNELISDYELKSLVESGNIEGLLGERERGIIDGIMDFSKSTADEIMLPRTEIEALSDTLTQDEVLGTLRTIRHSRIPVYHETIDSIVGVIHVKEVLLNPTTPYREFLREPLFIPEKRALTDLLADFQRARVHLAVVVDEYGGTSGFVALADLLQEIINSFEQEEEEQEPPLRQISENRWIVQGDCEIGQFNRELRTELSDAMSRTVGGFVTATLGRFPRPQETLTVDNVTFTVLRMDAHRVRLLRVQLREEELEKRTQESEE